MGVEAIKQRVDNVASQAGVPKDSYSFSRAVAGDMPWLLDIDVKYVPSVVETRVAGTKCGRADIDNLPASVDGNATRLKILQLATAKAASDQVVEDLAKDIGERITTWAKYGLKPTPIETGHNARCLENCEHCKSRGKHICKTCGGDAKLRCNRCRGNGVVTCGTCGGDARRTCSSCNGSGRISHFSGGSTHYMNCPGCFGSGRCLGCYTCGRTGQEYCNGCDGVGEIGCSSCSSTGNIVCRPCSGHGVFVRTFVGTIKAEVNRTLGYMSTEIPEFALLFHFQNESGYKPQVSEIVKKPGSVSAKMTIIMPLAAVTLNVGKDAYRIQAGGSRMSWAKVPPYLDKMLAGFVATLENAPAREAHARILELNASEFGAGIVKGVVTGSTYYGTDTFGGAVTPEMIKRVRLQVERFLGQATVGPRSGFWIRFAFMSALLTVAVAIAFPYLNDGSTAMDMLGSSMYPRTYSDMLGITVENTFVASVVAAVVTAVAFLAGNLIYRFVSRKWLASITGIQTKVPAKAGIPAIAALFGAWVLGTGAVLLVQHFPSMVAALTA